MGEPFRTAVAALLRDRRLGALNFAYGPVRIYPSGYRDVAQLVEDGHIVFRLTSGLNASFEVDTPRGTPHPFNVPTWMAEEGADGVVRVKGALSIEASGTIVHEATHALQDYQRLGSRPGGRFTPRTAEGAAYVAAWMARIILGQPRLGRPIDRGMIERTSHAYARYLAEELLDRRIVYLVPPDDVRRLDELVLIGSPSRYVFEGY